MNIWSNDKKKNIFDDKLVYQGTYISDILKHPLVSYLSIIFTAMKKLISYLKTTLDIIKNTCPNFFWQLYWKIGFEQRNVVIVITCIYWQSGVYDGRVYMTIRYIFIYTCIYLSFNKYEKLLDNENGRWDHLRPILWMHFLIKF